MPGLRPADRADFAQALRSALDSPEFRAALSADVTGRAARRLYAGALAAQAEIAAAARDEYRAYAAARAAAGRRTSPAEGPPLAGGTGLPPTVLLALISAVSAAVLLLIGHGLLLAGAAVRFAGSVRSAGWVLSVAAVAAAALGAAARPRAAPGGDAGTRGPVTPVSADDVEQARRRWQRALLERGVLPHLRRRLPASLAPEGLEPPPRQKARRHMSVNLSKGQQISLSKSDGTALNAVRMGLGWQAAQRKGFLAKLTGPRDIDLDASALLFAGGQLADVAFFQHLTSDDGSVRHLGDNLTGGSGAGGDDEVILVDLGRVPAHVDQIVFTVNSFTGQTFAEVQNAFCRLVDENTGQEMARYTLSGGGTYTAQIMAKLHRRTGGWQLKAIGEPAAGRTFQDLLPTIVGHL